MNEPKKELDLSEWPKEKQLLLKMAEAQFHMHRLLVAGAEVMKSARAGTSKTANVTRSSLAALGVELQRASQIKWPTRKQSWWRKLFSGKPNSEGQPTPNT